MSEEMIIQYCSPVLAGLKTGNMFTCPYASRKAVFEEIRELNRLLRGKGMTAIPLKFMKKKVLIYIFRNGDLSSDLRDPEVCAILKENGYPVCVQDGSEPGNAASYGKTCLQVLIGRLRESDTFPHEIGCFLGYPPEDVRGFIEHRAVDYKYQGYWKVYGDVEKCRRRFQGFRKCTDLYCRLLGQGKTLEDLCVRKHNHVHETAGRI